MKKIILTTLFLAFYSTLALSSSSTNDPVRMAVNQANEASSIVITAIKNIEREFERGLHCWVTVVA